MKNLSIRSKLSLLLLSVALIFGALIAFSIKAANETKQLATDALRENLLEQQRGKIQTATHSMAVSLAERIEGVESEEARARMLRSAVDKVRFEDDGSGYYFIYDGTVNIALPIKIERVGQDLRDTTDPYGVFFVRELAEEARKGGGFVSYHFDKPGKGITPKISYAEPVLGTTYWIGTGVYLDNIAEQAAQLDSELSAAIQKSNTILFAILGVLFVGVILPFSLLITRSIAKPLEAAMQRLKRESAQMLASSREIATASDKLAADSSEQAASIEETSASIQEIAGLSDNNSRCADEATVIMRAANQSIQDVSELINALHSSMGRISDSSSQMQKIIKTIDEIAFQTNILALNAAVEAARAGNAGSGFAVVADEVRSLAGRSAAAAKSTASLIENSVALVGEGSQVMDTARKSFSEMKVKAGQVGEMLARIEGYSKQQSSGVGQINVASGQMNEVVQRNAARAEECAAAAAELDSLSLGFGDIVELIERAVRGRASRGATEASPAPSDSPNFAERPRAASISNRKAAPREDLAVAQSW